MKKKLSLLTLILVLVLIFSSCNSYRSDYEGPWWTQAGATSNHIGTLDTADFDMPGLGWVYRIPTGSHSLSTPIVVDDLVYFGSTDGIVYCLYSKNGNEKWKYQTEGSISNSPSYHDGVLYVTSNDGCLYALDPINGDLLWFLYLGGAVNFNHVITDNNLLVAGIEDTDETYASVVAVDLEKETVAWTYTVLSWIDTDMTYYNGGYDGGMIFFGAQDAYYYALNASTGKFLWAYDTYSSDLEGATVYDDKLYFGSGMGVFYCFNVVNDPDIVLPIWTAECDGQMWVSGTPAIKDGYVVFASYDNNVRCYDAETGEFKWRWTGVYSMTGSVTIIGNSVLVGGSGKQDNKYYLFCLDFDTGEYRWSSQAIAPVRPAPSVVDGCIFYTDELGQVIKLA